MAIIKTKNMVPQVYVSESRDFQLFTRVLDFTQNSIKFDIDAITDVIDTETIHSDYLDRLKSKLGFYTSNVYDNRTLRIVLSAFPHIVRYKGSEEGIVRCVNTFLKIIGVNEDFKVDIYNAHDTYPYTIRVGIKSHIQDLRVLKDMLSYVVPTGYLTEIYFYSNPKMPNIETVFDSQTTFDAFSNEANSVRLYSDENPTESELTEEWEDSVLGTVGLSVVDNADTTTKIMNVEENEADE